MGGSVTWFNRGVTANRENETLQIGQYLLHRVKHCHATYEMSVKVIMLLVELSGKTKRKTKKGKTNGLQTE
jgi:hypothetical protein